MYCFPILSFLKLHYIYSIFFRLSLPVHSGSLKRIDYPKQLSGPPSFFLMYLLLFKELIIIFLFVVTAAGVVPCGIPKKRSRTSSIVQFIFYFLVLSDQQKCSEKPENIIGLDSYILNSFSYLNPI